MDESELRRRLGAGETVDLRTGDPELDDPANADDWGPEREVPASLLGELATIPVEQDPTVRQLRLYGARITGALDLNTAVVTRRIGLYTCAFDEPPILTAAELIALSLSGSRVSGLCGDGLQCRGDITLHDGFTATGEVRLVDARIGGQLNLRGASLSNPGGDVLAADGLTVNRGMVCGDLATHGGTRLLGAHIGGHLSFRGARIGSQLNFRGARFYRAPRCRALVLERTKVSGVVSLQPRVLDGAINLGAASTQSWQDNETARGQSTWLEGFRYDSITSADHPHDRVEVQRRLRWVERNTTEFHPQPYEQLASVYAAQGDADAARRVQVAKQRRWRANPRNPLRRWTSIVWSTFLRMMVGYGYRPWRVLWPLLGLLVGGTWLFGREHAAGRIVSGSAASGEGGDAGAAVPEFSGFRYTLDLLLPVIGLREDATYTALESATWYAFGFTCAGWLLALTLVAALSGVFKRSS